MTPTLNPTKSTERIQALDFLRGFAILGILLMNIQSFSMPGAAYTNPMAYGDMDGINKWVWILSHVFADQKFISIFSILYGAGIILVTERISAKGGRPGWVHYRRTFWLLVIGLIHAHLIWYGDILVAYALCALLAYLFRKMKPLTLLIIGLLVMSVHSALYLWLGSSIPYWPEEALAQAREGWAPAAEALQREISELTGSLSEQVSHNSSSAVFMETMVFLIIFLWRALGLMLVGMALYKWGVLTAKRSASFYRRGVLLGAVTGFPLTIYGVIQNYDHDWSMEYSQFIGSQYNYWGSLLVSFSYICLVMRVAQSTLFSGLKKRLAAVGQMALTNYLMQSILAVLVFYGIGMGLFGSLERWEQLLVVFGIWLLQVAWSEPWLKKYRFGPAEWLWRSLTYRQVQDFKKK